MTFISVNNKYLRVRPGVVLTEHLDPVIFALDEYFKAANLVAFVTSGLRDAASQLRIIRNALAKNGLAETYGEAFDDIDGKMMFEGKQVYSWQPGWSKLLNIGFIVNPPYAAECLLDYIRPGSTENRKGKIIQPSPHFNGLAFDVSGGTDGVANEANIIQSAVGKIKGLKGILIERNNNAIHCDVNKTSIV